MDPETKRLAIVVVIGLLVMFPVFNQVAYAMLDTLTTADHQARFSEFFKSWDDVPTDRKLEYWDGRNVPPGQWDPGQMDDDASIRDGGGAGGENGSNGGGRDDGSDDGRGDENEAQPPRYKEVVLWEFHAIPSAEGKTLSIAQGHDYEWVNVTWDYAGFTGSADFELKVAGNTEWRITPDTVGTVALSAADTGATSIEEAGRAALDIHYEYSPSFGAPQRFDITVVGTYLDTD